MGCLVSFSLLFLFLPFSESAIASLLLELFLVHEFELEVEDVVGVVDEEEEDVPNKFS